MKVDRIQRNMYRLKRELITEEIEQTVPTICKIERTLEWWTSRNLATIDDLELIPYNNIKK